MGRRLLSVASAALVLILTTSSSLGIVIRHDRTQAEYINLGASSRYTSVGMFNGTFDGGGGFSASGTIIAPGWVLTAGHVVSDAASLSFNIGGNTYVGDAWAAHPNWNGNLTQGFDFGLVHLATSPSITPATRYRGTTELGRTGTYVGFGRTGTGLTGATIFDGLKRAATNVLDLFYNSNNRILTSDFDRLNGGFFSNLTGSRTPTNLEGLVGPGDSGGGMFIDINGQAQLAGVISFIGASPFDFRPDSDYGDYSGAMRVSAVNSWIDATLAAGLPANLAAATLAPGSLRAAAIPEPASLGLVMLGLLLSRRGQRARRA